MDKTSAQLIDEIVAHWRAVVTNTRPANRREVEQHADAVYLLSGHKPPKHYQWLERPEAILNIRIAKMGDLDTGNRNAMPLTFNNMRGDLQNRITPLRVASTANMEGLLPMPQAIANLSFLAHWQYAIASGVWKPLPVQRALHEYISELRAGVHCFHLGQTEAILFERPAVVKLDSFDRLHCATGPALVSRGEQPFPSLEYNGMDTWLGYRTSSTVDYYWNGLRVPWWVVMKPEFINLMRIAQTPNQEVKRVMIERYDELRTAGAYLFDSGGRLIHRDEFGELYQCDDITMVKVRNSTPEPDGSYRYYFLTVDPMLRPMKLVRDPDGKVIGKRFLFGQALTARNAVASTWGLYGEQYQPAYEA